MFKPASAPKNVAGEETRARLLEAATEVFLAEGFRSARVHDIAQRAGLRLSSINYHFGSKEGLYLAVLQYHANDSLRSMAFNLPPTQTIPARVRLEAAISGVLLLHVGQQTVTKVPQLLMRELSNPTPALEEIIKQFTLPLVKDLQVLLGEILGPSAPPTAVNRAAFSLLGQCVMYAQAHPIVTSVDPAIASDPNLIANTTRHITDFTWAGLQAMRQQWDTQPSS